MTELKKIYCAACGNCKLSRHYLNPEKTKFIKIVKCSKNLWTNARSNTNHFDHHTLALRTMNACNHYNPFVESDKLAEWLRNLFINLPNMKIVYEKENNYEKEANATQ